MLIYNYHVITKEYIDSSEASLDPEETKVQGKEVYLIPANATDKKPSKAPKNKVNVFENNNWVLKDDFRGQSMVNEEMHPVEVTDIGELPEGYVLITEEQIELLNEKGENYFIIEDGELIVNPDYEQEEAEKEAARIEALSMTRSDFFDGTIRAFGLDSDDLLIAIQAVLETITLPEVEKKVAINNYKNALNFYRKHPLFTVLADVPIPVEENITVVITSEQWDRFFDETDKGNPEAYKCLLPPTE